MTDTPDELERDETISDLDVPAEQADDVKGGIQDSEKPELLGIKETAASKWGDIELKRGTP